MTMAQRIVIMRNGVIQQIGSPKDVYKTPANTFVAGFVGSPGMNLLPLGNAGNYPRGAATIGCRPENVLLNTGTPGAYALRASVLSLQPLGATMMVDLQTQDQNRLVALVEWRDNDLAAGKEVEVFFPSRDVSYFDSDGRRLNEGY